MIRAAELSDVEQILEIYAPYVRSSTATFEYDVPDLDTFTRRFLDITQQFPWLVWEEDGEILGYAYGSRAFERAAYAWNAEISCYLAPSARGRGVGRRLYAQIEEILRDMGVRKVFAVVTSANAPSVAFHRALGYRDAARFTDVGFKHGAWYDVLWLEKQLCPLGTPEAFPTPWR